MELTPEQLDFIEAVRTLPYNLRLDAVAGSGKTSTIIRASHVLPRSYRILALAFNRAIADELSRRFPAHVECRTMNSLGFSIWNDYASRKKIHTRKPQEIYKRQNISFIEPDERDPFFFDMMQLFSVLRNSGCVPSGLMKSVAYPPEISLDQDTVTQLCDDLDLRWRPEVVFPFIQNMLLDSISTSLTEFIDFDDQIYMPTYFANNAAFPRYDCIFIDEAQDLSPLQHDFIQRLAGATTRIIAVGDPYQAIYGWRGASSRSLDKLSERFDMRTYPLSATFRCPSNIVSEVHSYVPHIKAVKEGGTVSTIQEADYQPEFFPPDSVILCRNNAPLIKTALRLLKHRVPFYYSNDAVRNTVMRVVNTIHKKELPFLVGLQEWAESECALAREKNRKWRIPQVQDTYATILHLFEAAQSSDPKAIREQLDLICARQKGGVLELSTIHKAKGREWNEVFFLFPSLIPSPHTSGELLKQEFNLQYVACTRAKERLTYIEMENQK